jgi:hypothetical protein
MSIKHHLRRGLLLSVATISVASGAAGAAGDETALPPPPAPPGEEATTPPGEDTAPPIEEAPPSTETPAEETADDAGNAGTVDDADEPSTTAAPEATEVPQARGDDVAADQPPTNVLATAPSQPLSVTAKPGSTIVQLTWAAPSSDGGAPVDKYAVQQFTNGAWQTIAEPAGLGYTVTNLANATKYGFRVLAHNTAGWSQPSAYLTAVPVGVPGPPLSPKVTLVNNGWVLLSWSPPSSNGGAMVDQYEVQWAKSTAGPWTSIPQIGSPGYTVSGLTPGTKYYFRVFAHNVAGWGSASSVVSGVPRKVPDAPAACSATASAYSSKQLVVWWEAPPSNGGAPITSYLIQLWKDGSIYGEVSAKPDSIYTTIQLYHSGLFYVRVMAANAAGWSAPCYTFEYV